MTAVKGKSQAKKTQRKQPHCVAATYPNTGSPKKKKEIKLVIFSPSAVEKSWHILPQPASRKGQWTPVVLWTTGLPGLHASPPEKGHHGSAWDVLFTNGVFYQKYDYETTKQHKQPLSGFSQDVLFFIYFSWRFPGLCHPWIFRRHLFGVRRRHAVGHVIRVVHLTAKHSTEEPGISMDIWDQLRSTGINWDQLGSTGDGSGQIIIIH